MEYLQYEKGGNDDIVKIKVLNLIINGIPSIHMMELMKHGLISKF